MEPGATSMVADCDVFENVDIQYSSKTLELLERRGIVDNTLKRPRRNRRTHIVLALGKKRGHNFVQAPNSALLLEHRVVNLCEFSGRGQLSLSLVDLQIA